VIVTGTDAADPRGGIGAAMSGFLAALEHEGLLARFIPSYHRRSRRGRWAPALRAIPAVVAEVRSIRREGAIAVVYSHAGGPVSVAREAGLLRAARGAGAATMLQVHSVRVYGRLRPLRPLLSGADLLCAPTPHWVGVLRDAGFPRVAEVPNPLPADAEAAATERCVAGAGPVLCMTRLVAGKGVEAALSAIVDLPVTLEVAGDGPLRPALEARAADLGIADRVRFLGWIAGEEKEAALRRASVFLLPTRHDSFGMGFLEAAARGVPSVGLRFAATPDVVVDGVTGVLADDEDGLAAALARALAHRVDLGNAARERAVGTYGRVAVGAAIRSALASLPNR
jgi:glycosyltransferase involved in cell wall biosynthesis